MEIMLTIKSISRDQSKEYRGTKWTELTYTSWLLSGISAGIKVKTDKTQHATHTKTGILDRHGIDLKRKTEARTPTTRNHQV